MGATPVAPLECCRVDPYKGDPRIIFNQWAQTCPVQLELHTYILVWLFTDQSEQLHKDQSEGAIPTNQESAIWTNQGPGRELHKSEPPACFQFPLSPVCKLVTGVKVFLFPLSNLGTGGSKLWSTNPSQRLQLGASARWDIWEKEAKRKENMIYLS